ncbi:hypothetical protein HDV05_005439 [Chytridiales sp. JEL 0842]|nr:hypothetical protein HDV05_005439 [Chytridiales sp. JEL 0842]
MATPTSSSAPNPPATPDSASSILSPTSATVINPLIDEVESLKLQIVDAEKEKTQLRNSLLVLEEQQKKRAEGFQEGRKLLRVPSDGHDETTDPLLHLVSEFLKHPEGQPGMKIDVVQLVKDLKERLDHQNAKMQKMAFELEMECGHVNILRAENLALKQQTVKIHAEAEREEEYITNRLIQRINSLKKEKNDLLMKVEQEEEQITNTLQRKLAQLQKEKVDMEATLEQEQEFIVNRLQRQLESLAVQQQAHSPGGANMTPLKKYFPSHTPPTQSTTTLDFPPSPSLSPGILEVMRAEMNALKAKLHDLEREYEDNASHARELYKSCKNELVQLKLQQQQLAVSPSSSLSTTSSASSLERGRNSVVEDVESRYPTSGFLPTLVPSSPSLGATTASLLALSNSGTSSNNTSAAAGGSGAAAPWSLERSRERSRGPSASRGSGAGVNGSLTELSLGSSVFQGTTSGRGKSHVPVGIKYKSVAEPLKYKKLQIGHNDKR